MLGELMKLPSNDKQIYFFSPLPLSLRRWPWRTIFRYAIHYFNVDSPLIEMFVRRLLVAEFHGIDIFPRVGSFQESRQTTAKVELDWTEATRCVLR